MRRALGLAGQVAGTLEAELVLAGGKGDLHLRRAGGQGAQKRAEQLDRSAMPLPHPSKRHQQHVPLLQLPVLLPPALLPPAGTAAADSWRQLSSSPRGPSTPHTRRRRPPPAPPSQPPP